jgi:hypothetical protein
MQIKQSRSLPMRFFPHLQLCSAAHLALVNLHMTGMTKRGHIDVGRFDAPALAMPRLVRVRGHHGPIVSTAVLAGELPARF